MMQNYSRLVIDCNRPPGVPSSIPVRSEHTDITGNFGLAEAAAEQRRRENLRSLSRCDHGAPRCARSGGAADAAGDDA
ncbi:MAG: N-formylglutamate amidohydrolase [Rhodospirillales bacterium]